MSFEPAYLALWRSGELARRAEQAQDLLHCCVCCGWRCRVDRGGLKDKQGVCRTGMLARVSSYGPHHGEESPLSGWRGSGAIFFADCNLCCQFCQNYDISQANPGPEMDAEALAECMLALQAAGCHNINFVSPTHVGPQILAALLVAVERGLRLPLVWNSGGYDSLALLALLDGIVDIYLPDMKYANARIAQQYSKAPSYPAVNQAAVRAMHAQVGDLQIGPDGLAQRGLLVRHLVLPHNLAGSGEVMRFLAQEISPRTYVNIMAQYRPLYRAAQYPKLNRRITAQEYRQALDCALEAGLTQLEQTG